MPRLRPSSDARLPRSRASPAVPAGARQRGGAHPLLLKEDGHRGVVHEGGWERRKRAGWQAADGRAPGRQACACLHRACVCAAYVMWGRACASVLGEACADQCVAHVPPPVPPSPPADAQVASLCSENVVNSNIPCCGMAGDRGMRYPELTAASLQHLAVGGCSDGYSTSRTW